MASAIRQRAARVKDSVAEDLRKKSKPSGWIVPKQSTTFSEPDEWTNIDMDVTPLERRTWSTWTMLGFCE